MPVFCPVSCEDNTFDVVAQLSLKLLPFNDDVEQIVRGPDPIIFDSERNAFGFPSLIGWNDLFDENFCFVKNDTINLDISIEGVDPNDLMKSRMIFENPYKSCDEICRAIFQLTIKNVDRLVAVQTPTFNKENMPWTVMVFKDRSDGLSVRLSWSLKVKYTARLAAKTLHIKLVPSMDIADSKELAPVKCIRPSQNYTTQRLISWTELLDPENGFIKDNSITINVEVKADGINGDSEELIQVAKTTVKQLECVICFDNIEDKEISSVACGHLFCTVCITKYVKDRGACPSCQRPASENDLRRTYLPQ